MSPSLSLSLFLPLPHILEFMPAPNELDATLSALAEGQRAFERYTLGRVLGRGGLLVTMVPAWPGAGHWGWCGWHETKRRSATSS